jgi:hypothetical protein
MALDLALDLALSTVSGVKASDVNEESAMVTSNVVDMVVFGHQPHPKIRIPSQMKPFKHRFYTVENDIIVDYDFTLLKTDVTPGSDLFRVSLFVYRNYVGNLINEPSISILFQVGDNFKNNSFLTSALKCYAAMCGFCIRSKTDRHKECSWAVVKRVFAAGDLKCCCKFHIIIKPCGHSTKVTVNADGTQKKTSRSLWNDKYYATIKYGTL